MPNEKIHFKLTITGDPTLSMDAPVEIEETLDVVWTGNDYRVFNEKELPDAGHGMPLGVGQTRNAAVLSWLRIKVCN